jgi:alkylation response protein AidB-like acyl-CoA dehydrogenase
MDFDLTPEQEQLRDAVAALGRRYGHEYFVRKAKDGGHTTELWAEAGRLGYLGVSVPEEFGGGGGGITELAIVAEELAAAGCPLLLIVVSPAIVATIIAKHGTAEQRKRFLPGLADGTLKIAFAITEPEAGSNFHRWARSPAGTAGTGCSPVASASSPAWTRRRMWLVVAPTWRRGHRTTDSGLVRRTRGF